MSAVHKLRAEAQAAHILKDALLRQFPSLSDDNQAIADMIEGETNLDVVIEAALREIAEREAYAEACRKLAKDYSDRAKRLDDGSTSIRNAIMETLIELGIKSMKFATASISVGYGPGKVVITDEEAEKAAVEAGFGKMVPKVDRAAIGRELKAGSSFSFATLSNGGPSLSIRRA